MSHTAMFGFSSGLCNKILFLWAPWDKIRPKVDAITGCRSTIMWITSPIYITISNKRKLCSRRSRLKFQSIRQSSFEISKDPFHCFPVSLKQIFHKLKYLINTIGNLRLCKSGILKCQNNGSIEIRIWERICTKSREFTAAHHGSINWICLSHISSFKQFPNVFGLGKNKGACRCFLHFYTQEIIQFTKFFESKLHI